MGVAFGSKTSRVAKACTSLHKFLIDKIWRVKETKRIGTIEESNSKKPRIQKTTQWENFCLKVVFCGTL